VIPRRIGYLALAWMTAYTFACFFAMRFLPRHLFRRPAAKKPPESSGEASREGEETP
jgi:hypothetical protein